MILNLAIWFALHTLFGQVSDVRYGPLKLSVPDWASVQIPAVVLTTAALIAVFRFKAGPMLVIPACAAAGIAYWAIVSGRPG